MIPFPIFRRKKKQLNNRTPQWFRDWHSTEFLPVSIRQDILIALVIGLLIAVFIKSIL